MDWFADLIGEYWDVNIRPNVAGFPSFVLEDQRQKYVDFILLNPYAQFDICDWARSTNRL